MNKILKKQTAVIFIFLVVYGMLPVNSNENDQNKISWAELPPLPNELGVAGPFVGVHRERLIVAGGANFPEPVWENQKQWLDDVYALKREGSEYNWSTIGKLPRRIAYGCSISVEDGVLCIGGCDASAHFSDVFLMRISTDGDRLETIPYPSLPVKSAYGAAAILDNVVYVMGGQVNSKLESATQSVWSLDLKQSDRPEDLQWKQLRDFPAANRAFHLLVASEDSQGGSMFLVSGRRKSSAGEVEFLRDVWRYTPRSEQWTRRSDMPACCMAGTGLALGNDELLIVGGADGSLFDQADILKDQHPGFPKQLYSYDCEGDRWIGIGGLPANHVTTVAVQWQDSIVIPTGEIRPRVRTPAVLRGFRTPVKEAGALR